MVGLQNVTPEAQTAVKSPELSPVTKEILKELGDNPQAKRFHFNLKHSGIDMELHCEGDRENFRIDFKRPFSGKHLKYVYEDGKFSKVVFLVDPIPGTPFSHSKEVTLTPQEVGVTEGMILYLIRQVKIDEINFRPERR